VSTADHQAGAARGDGKEFMASLAKGLKVLSAFGEKKPTMSLTEAAAVAGISRAAARRVLLTLAELGYVEQNGRDFTLAPRILELGFGYLSIQPWIDRAQPLLKELSLEFQESFSAATLQGAEIVFVARVAAPGMVMSSSVAVGTRLPAFHTALGRAQLGYVDEAEVWTRLKALKIEAFTPNTITDLSAIVERVKEDRLQGFSIVDEELERGLRALAVPLVSRGGRLLGAIGSTVHASRTTRNEMRSNILPRLKDCSGKISQSIP
jgi:IclR family transcriptional regulator, pca regulon regulatory protein